MIPFLDLKAVNAPYRARIEAAAARVLERGRYILDEEVSAFEREFAEYLGVRHVVGTGNGLDAISLSLRGLGLAPGDEVLVPGNTLAATALGVSSIGCRPVFVEPRDATADLDPDRLEAAITPRTRAILPVHLYGRICDMDAIRDIAARHGLFVVEDACQAHGARLGGRYAGALSDAGAFSFYPTKNLGALGDGGAVATDDGTLAARIRSLRSYGSERIGSSWILGGNSRLDELQAAILREKLPGLAVADRRRQDLADLYRASIHHPSVRLPAPHPPLAHAWHLFVVRAPDRDGLAEHLRVHGVETAVHYRVPACLQPVYRGPDARPCPLAERMSAESLSLPLNTALEDDDVRRIAACVDAWAGR